MDSYSQVRNRRPPRLLIFRKKSTQDNFIPDPPFINFLLQVHTGNLSWVDTSICPGWHLSCPGWHPSCPGWHPSCPGWQRWHCTFFPSDRIFSPYQLFVLIWCEFFSLSWGVEASSCVRPWWNFTCPGWHHVCPGWQTCADPPVYASPPVY